MIAYFIKLHLLFQRDPEPIAANMETKVLQETMLTKNGVESELWNIIYGNILHEEINFQLRNDFTWEISFFLE